MKVFNSISHILRESPLGGCQSRYKGGYERLYFSYEGKTITEEREKLMNIKDKIKIIIEQHSTAIDTPRPQKASEDHRLTLNCLGIEGLAPTIISNSDKKSNLRRLLLNASLWRKRTVLNREAYRGK